jgi:hypothetical protein
MKFTIEEIGELEYKKSENDRAWFKGVPTAARAYARNRGAMCCEQLIAATSPNALGDLYPDHHFARFQRDAMMFARMAFRGWRAYRLMVGE